jgi:hypothetical protein
MANASRMTTIGVTSNTAHRIHEYIRMMRESGKRIPIANEIVSLALDALDREQAQSQNVQELIDMLGDR